MNSTCNDTLFSRPQPLRPWGAKRSILLNLNYKVNFKDFLNKTLCVFSHMKDIKNVRWDFHSVSWVIPQGLGLGVLGVKNLIL